MWSVSEKDREYRWGWRDYLCAGTNVVGMRCDILSYLHSLTSSSIDHISLFYLGCSC